MRKESLVPNGRAEIKSLSCYHGGHFESLKFFNSDRSALLNRDYTVSEQNTKSVLSILKPNSVVGGYGIEMETMFPEIENERVMANLFFMISEKLFPHDLFKMEQDCTVDAEFVSQVMSKSFIRNNYKNFKTMWNEYFPAFGITTDDQRCGMHVNISNSLFGKDEATQYENIRKLGYLINRHYDFFKIAFHRCGTTRWCPQMTTNKDFWKTADWFGFPTDHSSCCYNVGHVRQGRIEIRLVGGQKNFAGFRNTMETIFFLVDRIKKISWGDLDDLAIVFRGCNNYVFDRISTNCVNACVITDEVVNAIRPTVKQEQLL